MNRKNLLTSTMARTAGVGLVASDTRAVRADRTKSPDAKRITGCCPRRFSKHAIAPCCFARTGRSAGKPTVFVHSWGTNSELWQYQNAPFIWPRLALHRLRSARSWPLEPARKLCGYDYDDPCGRSGIVTRTTRSLRGDPCRPLDGLRRDRPLPVATPLQPCSPRPLHPYGNTFSLKDP